MNFHVGQRVVCVDDKDEGYAKSIFAGRVYTIRWVGIREANGKLCVRLHGLERFNFDGEDVPLLASRFRPVVERKTDISQFQAMLTDKKVEVVA